MARTLVMNAEFRGIVVKFGKGDNNKQPQNIANVSRNNINVDEYNCGFCGVANSELMCSGCYNEISGTYYCSDNHQARDWARHKSECKSMPNLIKRQDHLDEIIAESPTLDLIPRTDSFKKFFITPIDQKPELNEEILITNVKSLRVIYARPVKDNGGYENLLDDIKTTAMILPNILHKPSINDHILAPYLNSFHRAKVLDIFETDTNDFNMKVFMVDFGDEIEVTWQECKDLNYRLRGLKSFIFKFVLDYVLVVKENREIIKYLTDIKANNEKLQISGISKMGNRITLKRTNGEIVNDVINSLALQATGTSLNSYEPVLYNVSQLCINYMF